MRSGAHLIARNTLLTAVRTFVRLGVGLAMVPILLDAIGRDRTGLFFFATTLTGYFTAVELGLATSLTKYVAEFRASGKRELLNDTLRATLLLLTVIGAIIATGFVAFAFLGAESLFHQQSVRSSVQSTMLVAGLVALAYWPTRVGFAALEGLERYDQSALVQTAGSIAMVGSTAALAPLHPSVALLVGVTGGLLVLQNIVACALALPHLELVRRGRWRGAHLRPVIGFGRDLFVIGIADTLIYSLDRTILAAFVGPGSIVVYELAVRLQSAVRSVSALAGGALMATVARLHAQGRRERLRELVMVGSLIGVLITTPVAVAIMVLARPLIEAWVGRGYGAAVTYAQIFTSYWLVHGHTGVLGSAVAGIGRIRKYAILAIVSGIVTLVLSVVLTWRWGTIGVILGTVIPAWLILPLWMVLALRDVEISAREYIRAVALPAYCLTAVWAVVFLLGDNLVQPHGLLEVAAFAVVGLGAFAAAAAPLVWPRWRHATS